MEEEKLFKEIEALKKKIIELERSQKSVSKGFFARCFSKLNILAGVFISAVMTTAILYAAQIEFTDGTVISAAQVNSNFTDRSFFEGFCRIIWLGIVQVERPVCCICKSQDEFLCFFFEIYGNFICFVLIVFNQIRKKFFCNKLQGKRIVIIYFIRIDKGS